ncbi:MAG: methyltransferase domain-containing protein [Asticcacaulis sp.]
MRERAIADTLLTLSAINRRFELALDMTAADGGFGRALATSDAAAKVGLLIEGDLSPRLLSQASGPARLVMDEEALPFGDEALGLIVGALGLHAVNDLPGVLVQIRRAPQTRRPVHRLAVSAARHCASCAAA